MTIEKSTDNRPTIIHGSQNLSAEVEYTVEKIEQSYNQFKESYSYSVQSYLLIKLPAAKRTMRRCFVRLPQGWQTNRAQELTEHNTHKS